MAVRAKRQRHDCEWRDKAEALEGEVDTLKTSLAQMQHQLAALTRRVLGPKSEKMPSLEKELRDGEPVDAASTKQKRQARRAARAKLAKATTVHEVPAAQRRCPECDSEKLSVHGPGKSSIVYEYVPAHFIAHQHIRQTLRCECGCLVTAEGPNKWWEKSQYGASFVAHLVTAKCADSIPLYRRNRPRGDVLTAARTSLSSVVA